MEYERLIHGNIMGYQSIYPHPKNWGLDTENYPVV